MNISYFTTYPLLIISFVALVFFIFAIIKANKANAICPSDAIETQGEIVNIRSSNGESSAFINVTILIEFNTQDNIRVRTEGRARIDVVNMPMYQVGNVVPLIYSKKDPKKISLKIRSPRER